MLIISYLLTGLGGFCLGALIEFGYLHIRGHKIVIPYIPIRSRNFTILAIMLSVISLVTIVTVQVNMDGVNACNRQFRQALAYNNAISVEQRQIDARASALYSHRRDLLDRGFLSIGQNINDRLKIIEAINDYNVAIKDITKEYDDLIRYKDSLDASRKPYPEPQCGR